MSRYTPRIAGRIYRDDAWTLVDYRDAAAGTTTYGLAVKGLCLYCGEPSASRYCNSTCENLDGITRTGDACECEDGALPGVLLMNTYSDDTENVERCDLCQRFESDQDAARALIFSGWKIEEGEDGALFVVARPAPIVGCPCCGDPMLSSRIVCLTCVRWSNRLTPGTYEYGPIGEEFTITAEAIERWSEARARRQ